jgi:hypothetical protein
MGAVKCAKANVDDARLEQFSIVNRLRDVGWQNAA